MRPFAGPFVQMAVYVKRAVDTGPVMMGFANATNTILTTEWLNVLSHAQNHQTEKNVLDMVSANYLGVRPDVCVNPGGVAKCVIYLVRVSPTAESLVTGMEIA